MSKISTVLRIQCHALDQTSLSRKRLHDIGQDAVGELHGVEREVEVGGMGGEGVLEAWRVNG